MAVPRSHQVQPHGHGFASAVTARVVELKGSDLYIYVESYGRQRSLCSGWVAKRSGSPARGDACLAAYDEHGNPWIVSWP